MWADALRDPEVGAKQIDTVWRVPQFVCCIEDAVTSDMTGSKLSRTAKVTDHAKIAEFQKQAAGVQLLVERAVDHIVVQSSGHAALRGNVVKADVRSFSLDWKMKVRCSPGRFGCCLRPIRTSPSRPLRPGRRSRVARLFLSFSPPSPPLAAASASLPWPRSCDCFGLGLAARPCPLLARDRPRDAEPVAIPRRRSVRYKLRFLRRLPTSSPPRFLGTWVCWQKRRR